MANDAFEMVCMQSLGSGPTFDPHSIYWLLDPDQHSVCVNQPKLRSKTGQKNG
jgi:hypothetical protein